MAVSNALLWYTTRGAGAVSMVLLSSVVVLGIVGTVRAESPRWPLFLTTGLHRNLALTTLVFLVLHIVTAVIDPYTNLGWLAAIVPFSSYYRTLWLGLGVIGFELLVAIVVTSLVRGLLGQKTWRAVHWLTYAAWPVGIAHGLGTGTDVWSGWLIVLTALCVGAVTIAAAYRFRAGPFDPLANSRAAFRGSVSRRELP
ncbi:MAG TPA: ferric reductase-like transmembrane domain-containing protein [Candidatus Dormibacteraeota bacterium]|nr:ferric reductase-like transmembrane domain-containing protein [Candidatus Dormibacteraeota bacterium]